MENETKVQKGEAFSAPHGEFESKPITETSMGMSKDGKFFIHTTKIVDIKPVGYLQKVLEK